MDAVTTRVTEPNFDSLYAASDDPWGYRTRWYEQRKRDVVMACLPKLKFAKAFEPGCGNGELSALLACRCQQLLAIDSNAIAVAAARTRVAKHPHVAVKQMRFPAEWPTGYFDLIVISELGYYLDAAELQTVGFKAAECLHRGGVLLACHWRKPLADGTYIGDEVHLRLAVASGLSELVRYTDDDFVLTVWSNDARSVATSETHS